MMKFFNPLRFFTRPLLVDLLTYAGVRIALWQYEWRRHVVSLMSWGVGLLFFLLCALCALIFAGWASVLALTMWLNSQMAACAITALLYLIVGYIGWRCCLKYVPKSKLIPTPYARNAKKSSRKSLSKTS